MSLLVRLPLNGNLNNYGSANVTVTNNGAIISDEGKLGKCYYFNNSYLDINYGSGLSVNNKSISCWFKPTDTNSSCVVFGALNGSNQRFYVGISNGTYNLAFAQTTYGRTTSAPVNLNEWVHLTMTVKDNVCKLYANGNFIESLTASSDFNIASNIFVGGRSDGYKIKGYYNDIRIYDHCLSESEIKHIIKGKGLQVWLPLNGDLTQQGLSSITVTNNGATIDNNGKIGKCYSFDGSDDYISLNGSILYDVIKGGSTPFTIAMWVYHADSTRAILFGDYNLSGYINFNIELTTAHKLRFYWNADPDYNSSLVSVGESTWTHITITYNGSVIKIYVNGILTDSRNGILAEKNKTTGSYYLGRDSRTGATTLNGKLNDFRLYDYALSEKEIKKISKGLVLHYSLDRGGSGQENNIAISKIANRGCNNFSYNSITNEWTMSAPISTSVWGVGIVINDTSIKWKSGESWVVSMEVYVPKVATWNSDINNKPDVSDISQYTGNDYDDQRLYCANGVMSSRALKVGWNKIWFTQRAPSTYGLYNYSTNFGIVTTNESSAIDIKIKNIKGEIIAAGLPVQPTPWCPNSTDIKYTKMGYNNNIEYDLSGYKNNGEKIGILTYTSDTPKYSASTHIGTTSSKIHISNFPTSGFGNSYSFAWWGKRSSNSPMFWGFSDGIRLNGMYIGTLWNTGDGSNNPIYKPGTTTTITAPSLNIWHHYVMTGDGTTCKLYLDGELYGQAKTYKAISGTSIYINGWDSGTQYCSDNTDISDFRIYATALSADDILSLYQNSV